VGLLVPAGGEAYTDFNYWRDQPLDIQDFTDSEDEEDDGDDDDDERTEAASIRSEDEGSEIGEDLEASYLSRESLDVDADEAGLEDSIVESVEGADYLDGGEYAERRYGDDGEEEYADDEDGEGDRTMVQDVIPSIEGGGDTGVDTNVERMRALDVKERSPTPRATPRR